MEKVPALVTLGLIASSLLHQTLFCSASHKRYRDDSSSSYEYTDTTDPDNYPTRTPLLLTIPALPPPAVVKKAPTIEETLSALVTCPICMAEKEMRHMSKLPCNHLFDRTCIEEWLTIGSTCPLCRIDPDILKEKNDDLFTFSITGKTQKVSAVIAAGGVVNATQCSGRTPLMEAAFHGREAVVKKLLEAGAKIHDRDWLNYTALFFATTGNHPRVVQALIDATPKEDRAILVNVYNNKGNMPLWFAVCKGNLSIVKKLVAAGADIISKNSSGYTPLQMAELKGFTVIRDYLASCAALES